MIYFLFLKNAHITINYRQVILYGDQQLLSNKFLINKKVLSNQVSLNYSFNQIIIQKI